MELDKNLILKYDKKERKRINYFENGDRFEDDFKNDNKERKAVYYQNNGNRDIGGYIDVKILVKVSAIDYIKMEKLKELNIK